MMKVVKFTPASVPMQVEPNYRYYFITGRKL